MRIDDLAQAYRGDAVNHFDIPYGVDLAANRQRDCLLLLHEHKFIVHAYDPLSDVQGFHFWLSFWPKSHACNPASIAASTSR